MSERTVIIICGPTASGKTDLSVEVARLLNTVVLSADSRQVYQEMSIGTARTTPEEMRGIKHYLIGHKHIQEDYHAGIFEEEATQLCQELFKEHDQVVMCGGTGLYIHAFKNGLDEMVASDPKVRADIQQSFDEKGLTWLQEQVAQADPVYYNRADVQNPQRLMRALEVIRISGKPYSSYRTGEPKKRPFNILVFGIEHDREKLYERIEKRVDRMIEDGWEEEARTLYPFRHLNALQTVGYTDWFDYFDGLIDHATAIEKIKQHTRNYAKRQMTWFKREEGIVWLPVGPVEDQARMVLSHLHA